DATEAGVKAMPARPAVLAHCSTRGSRHRRQSQQCRRHGEVEISGRTACMPERATIRIFISSPTDVRPERLKAEQIVARLNREFAYHFHVDAVQWEREPLVATHHFQDPENIPQPRGTDIVIVILWSRLGLTLPGDQFRGAISGRPVTGTEW